MYGELPPDGELELGSLRLPEGRRLLAPALFPDFDSGPVLWATSAPVRDAGRTWLALHEARDETGLVPILYSGQMCDGCALNEVDELDPAEVLKECWDSSLDPEDDDPEQLDQVAPFGFSFPGLTPAQHEPLTAAETAQALGMLRPARIGLVRAGRSSDVLALAGFNGTVNRYGSPAMMTAVLRSWEDRFGAVLLEVGFDELRLLVRRPPRTRAAAEAAAAEIWAMCDEFHVIDGSQTALWNVGEIAGYIAGAPLWTLLWAD
jgi:hypothetical protein